MTYSVSITITRPNKDIPFLPQGDANAQSVLVARKASAGYVREERTHSGNVLSINHVWQNKADYDAFETGNKTALESARAVRDQYFTDHGITSSTTWIDE